VERTFSLTGGGGGGGKKEKKRGVLVCGSTLMPICSISSNWRFKGGGGRGEKKGKGEGGLLRPWCRLCAVDAARHRGGEKKNTNHSPLNISHPTKGEREGGRKREIPSFIFVLKGEGKESGGDSEFFSHAVLFGKRGKRKNGSRCSAVLPGGRKREGIHYDSSGTVQVGAKVSTMKKRRGKKKQKKKTAKAESSAVCQCFPRGRRRDGKKKKKNTKESQNAAHCIPAK